MTESTTLPATRSSAGLSGGAFIQPTEMPPDFIARDDRSDRAPHPEFVAAGSSLASVVVAIAAALLVIAAALGPLVRYMTPEEIPPTQSHDEPPGSSGHHGPSGTLNPKE